MYVLTFNIHPINLKNIIIFFIPNDCFVTLLIDAEGVGEDFVVFNFTIDKCGRGTLLLIADFDNSLGSNSACGRKDASPA